MTRWSSVVGVETLGLALMLIFWAWTFVLYLRLKKLTWPWAAGCCVDAALGVYHASRARTAAEMSLAVVFVLFAAFWIVYVRKPFTLPFKR